MLVSPDEELPVLQQSEPATAGRQMQQYAADLLHTIDALLYARVHHELKQTYWKKATQKFVLQVSLLYPAYANCASSTLMQLALVDGTRIWVNPMLGNSKTALPPAGRASLQLLRTIPFDSGAVLFYHQPTAIGNAAPCLS